MTLVKLPAVGQGLDVGGHAGSDPPLSPVVVVADTQVGNVRARNVYSMRSDSVHNMYGELDDLVAPAEQLHRQVDERAWPAAPRRCRR